jgi:hypothetical protein
MSGFKNIGVVELGRMMQKCGARLLDVPPDEKIAQGKIPQGWTLHQHLIPLKLAGLDKNNNTFFITGLGDGLSWQLRLLCRIVTMTYISCKSVSLRGPPSTDW